ncbi:MAG TPA: hypothetical protein VFG57_04170 [Gaiella sp.]|nr:hypothetical protein [Gaiella sp.]
MRRAAPWSALRRMACGGACTTRAAGVSTLAAGFGLVGLGLWARRDVRRGLERERIVSTPGSMPPSAPVVDAAAARSLAEVIRDATLSSTGGTTYGDTPSYVDAEGRPTPDRKLAALDPVTRKPVQNPAQALWLQSTTLQTALMQAYLAQRVAELTVGLGAVLVGVGTGLAAVPRR